ncbi:uncharacterized protein LOC116916161 [Daphnia magna]|nr:uncharacterized protein LOC116916161 [Daphnia magna]
MAFMIPVVRNDWDVWMRSRKPHPPDKISRNGQTTESRTGDPSLSTTPDRSGSIVVENVHRKRSLAIEIRNQQHLRISGGSLPSNFQSAHVGLPVSRSSLRHGRPLTSRFRSMHSSYRIGNNHALESDSPISPIKPENAGTASLSNCFEEVTSSAKIGSQNSLQKFHTRLVDRLRRSLRLSSSSASDGGENGSRTSS